MLRHHWPIRRWPILAFVVWTLYVWTTRIVNGWSDEATSTPSKIGTTVLSLSFLAFAVGTGLVLVRSRQRRFTGGEAVLLRLFASYTAFVWVVRGIQIVLDDRTIAFKVVHLVLGIISIGLAASTWRLAKQEMQRSGREGSRASDRRAPASTGGSGGSGGSGRSDASAPSMASITPLASVTSISTGASTGR